MKRLRNRCGGQHGAGASRRARSRRTYSASEILRAGDVLGLHLTRHKAAQAARVVANLRRTMNARRSASPPREVFPAVTMQIVPPPGDRDPGNRLRTEDERDRSRVAEKLPADSSARRNRLAFAKVGELADFLESGQTTSRELTELSLERLSRHGPRLNCLVRLCADRARRLAEQADAERASGRVRSRLHGIPWGAKDLFDTRDIPTEYGAEPFIGRVPRDDAEVVRLLDDAGAVLVAKLSLGALAYGDVWYGGRTNNPWDERTGSSGSSAGSAAAVVAGLVPFALGTETMGSIISPSITCGAAGLRPTFGRVPRGGTMPLAWSYDKIGPIARTAECTSHVLNELRADSAEHFETLDPDFCPAPYAPFGRSSLKGIRIGMAREWFRADSGSDGALQWGARSVREAIERCGGECVPIDLPNYPYESLFLPVYAEAAASFERMTESGEDEMLAAQGVENWPNLFRSARFLPASDYVEAQRLRRTVARDIDRLFFEVDALMAPLGATELLLATNGSGHPSLTIRTGFSGTGMPIGATLYGRYWEESALAAIGGVIEAELGAVHKKPEAMRE
ncbi:MAG: amidase [bacterium]